MNHKNSVFYITLSALFLIMPYSSYGLDVSGTINTDTTWTLADSPIRIVSNVTVQSGVILMIDSDVQVVGDPGCELTIRGRLEADEITLSLTGESLEFASGSSGWIRSSTLNFYERAGWGDYAGVQISSTDVLIEGNQIIGSSQLDDGSGVYITAGSPIIRSNTITGYSGGISTAGLNIFGGSPLIENNEVFGNKYGFRIGNTDAVIMYNNIYNNGNGIYIISDASPTISYCNIYSNYQYDLYNDSSNTVMCPFNWWGTTDLNQIRSKIYDGNDDPNLGIVYFQPILTAPYDGAVQDTDGDGISDDGDNSGVIGDNPCTGGETENCDDNCIDVSNPDQADSDGDGIGDACDEGFYVFVSDFQQSGFGYDITFMAMENGQPRQNVFISIETYWSEEIGDGVTGTDGTWQGHIILDSDTELRRWTANIPLIADSRRLGIFCPNPPPTFTVGEINFNVLSGIDQSILGKKVLIHFIPLQVYDPQWDDDLFFSVGLASWAHTLYEMNGWGILLHLALTELKEWVDERGRMEFIYGTKPSESDHPWFFRELIINPLPNEDTRQIGLPYVAVGTLRLEDSTILFEVERLSLRGNYTLGTMPQIDHQNFYGYLNPTFIPCSDLAIDWSLNHNYGLYIDKEISTLGIVEKRELLPPWLYGGDFSMVRLQFKKGTNLGLNDFFPVYVLIPSTTTPTVGSLIHVRGKVEEIGHYINTNVENGFHQIIHGEESEVGDIEYLSLVDFDYDGIIDLIEDEDGNGVCNPGETCPYDVDTDDDGLADGNTGSEDLNANGIVDPGETDPSNPDTDGDGIYDGTEKGLTTPETDDTDQSAGFFVPDEDPSTTTDPTDSDTDSDGLSDGEEDINKNGAVDENEPDPNDSDTDDDGYTDGEEVAAGSDPTDPNDIPPSTTSSSSTTTSAPPPVTTIPPRTTTTTTTGQSTTTTSVPSTTTTAIEPPTCEVNITPPSATVSTGQTISFGAETVGEGCEKGSYEWTVDSSIGSNIDDNGVYTAGTGAGTDTVTAEDVANGTEANAEVIVYTETTTTTFISLLWPMAYDKMWGAKKYENLLLLRVFRDEILLNTKIGREYIFMVYDNSLEIATLLLQEPSMTIQTREVIDELLMSVESLIYTDEIEISQDTIDNFLSLLDEFETKASPKLKTAINKIRRDIYKGEILKQLGISASE